MFLFSIRYYETSFKDVLPTKQNKEREREREREKK